MAWYLVRHHEACSLIWGSGHSSQHATQYSLVRRLANGDLAYITKCLKIRYPNNLRTRLIFSLCRSREGFLHWKNTFVPFLSGKAGARVTEIDLSVDAAFDHSINSPFKATTP